MFVCGEMVRSWNLVEGANSNVSDRSIGMNKELILWKPSLLLPRISKLKFILAFDFKISCFIA